MNTRSSRDDVASTESLAFHHLKRLSFDYWQQRCLHHQLKPPCRATLRTGSRRGLRHHEARVLARQVTIRLPGQSCLRSCRARTLTPVASQISQLPNGADRYSTPPPVACGPNCGCGATVRGPRTNSYQLGFMARNPEPGLYAGSARFDAASAPVAYGGDQPVPLVNQVLR